MRLITVMLSAFFLTACSVGGSIDAEQRNKEYACTDTRDGEVFYFHGSTIRNIRVSFDGASFVVTDHAGNVRTISKASEAWLKCKAVTP